MTAPDQTAAFEADAQVAQQTDEAAELRERLRQIENDKQQSAEVEERHTIVDAQGNEITDEDADDEVVAPNVAEVAGTEFRFYAPKQTALLAFGLGTSNKRKGQLVMSTMQRFIGFHLDDESYDAFMERMSDPNDDWGDNEFGELVNHIVEAAKESDEANAPTTGPRRV